MTNSVLITGASGLIGRRLTEILLQKGCRVSHLGRAARGEMAPAFQWNPERGILDGRAFEGVDTVINLAGAGIADKRWSAERKRIIVDSRVKSIAVLADFLNRHPHTVKTVIAASAIGYYGGTLNNTEYSEESGPGTDFLSTVVARWEEEANRLLELPIRLVKVRIGIVLSRDGGALKEMMLPIKWGVGAPLGTGRQYMSWIHVDDLCELFALAIEQPLSGVYNAVAPNPVTNRELTRAIGAALGRKILLPPVPHGVMKLMLGEMAEMVTKGARVSCRKILNEGFTFRYPRIEMALENLLAGNKK